MTGPADHKCVIWDFDGTLAVRPDMWCTSIAEACRISTGRSDILASDFADTAYRFLPWNGTELRHGYAGSPARWWHAFLTHVEPLVAERLKSSHGARRALRHVRPIVLDAERYSVVEPSRALVGDLLRRGLPQYVLSNHVPELGEIVAKLFPGRFERVWTSGSIGFEKPRVEIFDHVLRELPHTPPSILFIGDDPDRDLRPARLAGMRALHVNALVSP